MYTTRVPRGGRLKSGEGHCDLRILYAIRQIIRAADIDSRQLAANHQITATQLVSLMAVVEKESVTAHDVARRVHVSASTLVGVLDRLESKGFIKRTRNVNDRREIAIVPTAAGRALVAVTPFPLQHSLGRAMGKLSASECEKMAASMERLVELMEIQEVSAAPMLEIQSVLE
jgi:DNA-binding MarR family transcriptional regulator